MTKIVMLTKILKGIRKIIQGFITGGADLGNEDSVRRVTAVNVTGVLIVLAALLWGLADWYFLAKRVQPIIEFAAAGVGVVFLWWQRRSKNLKFKTILFVLIVNTFLLIINFFSIERGGVINTNSPWLFLSPLVSYFIAGETVGLISTVAVFVWLLIFTVLGYLGLFSSVDPEMVSDFLSVFIVLSILSYLYETARRNTQMNLRQAIDFREDIIKHASLGIYTVNSKGIIESVNPAMNKIAGGDKAPEREGANVFKLEFFRQPGLADAFQSCLSTGRAFELEDVDCKSQALGKRSLRHYRGVPIKREDGKVMRLLLLVEDVTELRDIEEGREILIQQLSGKNEELERFVYVISHDLRSPLTSLRGYLDEVQSEIAEGNKQMVQKDLDNIEKLSINMGQMIDDLLALSRAGKEEFKKQRVDFNQLVQKILANFDIQIKDKGFTVEVMYGLPKLLVSRGAIGEVFSNLISNALKFAEDKPEPKIEIGFKDREDECHIFVRDNGVGILPEDKRKLFDLFFRHGKKAGTGVGLSIVKEYVQMHGGRVWVESVEGKGSTFWFSIPK